MLYNQLCRLILRIMRGIGMPNGHLILVAMKGFGLNSLIKLACFTAQ
jgi:hypothetical protein